MSWNAVNRRLWKSGANKRILFLVDRSILADQTKTNEIKPFGQAITKITNCIADKAFEIYRALYQAVAGTEEDQDIYRRFSPDFFDLSLRTLAQLQVASSNLAHRHLNLVSQDCS